MVAIAFVASVKAIIGAAANLVEVFALAVTITLVIVVPMTGYYCFVMLSCCCSYCSLLM